MGLVYEAYDLERSTPVALKTLRHIDARALARFKREFRALQDLEHPNLISFGELIADCGEWFFTMELVDGEDFVSHVRHRDEVDSEGPTGNSGPMDPTFSATSPTDSGPLADTGPGLGALGQARFDEPRLRRSLDQLARGIDALHQGGKLHRDIKPQNILVTSTGRVVLLDFGLVTDVAANRQSSATSLVGTAEYMAPEQALGKVVGPAADWYAMGVVLYEALTCRLPHVGTSAFDLLMRKQDRVPILAERLVSEVPSDLSALCQQLLHIEPSRRPLGDEILERLAGGSPDLRATDTAPRPRAASCGGGSAFVQETPFVGRHQELALLRTAFADSRKGAAVSVFVHGESGLGKSELVGEFTRSIVRENQEVVVLQGRCYERESVPYKAFDGIADSLSRYLGKLPDLEVRQLMPVRSGLLPLLFPALQQVDAIAGARKQEPALLDPQERRTRMFHAFRALLARLADRHPVVLVIDDFQWAGADSLTMLQEVMHEDDAPELLLLGTARPGSEDLLAKHCSGDVRHLRLEELPSQHARELVLQLATGVDEEQTQAIVEETSGHPLFIMELVRHFSHGGRAGAIRLDDALWDRVGGLEPATRVLLEVLAVAGAPIAQATAAVAAGLAYADYERAVRSLRIGFLARTRARGADTVEPYHDRVREAVLARLQPESRTRHHRELANALEQAGVATTDPYVLVRHLTAAGQSQRAADHAEIAAARAKATSAFDHAASLFTTALELGSHDADQRRSLQLSLGEALVGAGRGPEAADVFLQVAQDADESTRLECKRQAAEQLLISGHLERGLEAMDTLLAEVGVRAPTSPRSVLFSVLWQRAKLRLRGLRWKEKQEAEISRDALTRVDLHKAAGHGYGLVDNIRAADFQARGLLLALRTGERKRVARAIFYEAMFLAASGPTRLPRARSMWEEGVRISAGLNNPYLDAWKISTSGTLQYFAGHYRAAADAFATAEQAFREQAGASWELSSMRLFRMWSLHRICALAEMAPLLGEYRRDAERRGDLYSQTTLVRSCHRVLLVTRSIRDAQQELEDASWVPAEGRYHLQHWYQFTSRAEFALFAGSSQVLLDEVQTVEHRLRQSLLMRIHPVRVDFAWLKARILVANSSAASSLSSALREAGRLARSLEGERADYARVMAKLVRAAVATQEGAPERAQTLLRAVVDDAEQEHMFLHAAAARYRLGEILGGDDGAQLMAKASALMAAEGAMDVARMTEMLAPGFAA